MEGNTRRNRNQKDATAVEEENYWMRTLENKGAGVGRVRTMGWLGVETQEEGC
jgi:hypothetical protein